jgi:hypothetical protein
MGGAVQSRDRFPGNVWYAMPSGWTRIVGAL